MDERLIKAIKEMSEGKESGFNVVYSENYNHVYFRAKQHILLYANTIYVILFACFV